MTDSSRPSLPPPSDADRSAASENASGSTGASPSDSSSRPASLDAVQANIPEPFREAVSALREQTRTAAETIRALRAENQRLRDRVEELSQRPDVGDDDAFAHFDDDRDALRKRIQHFIDAIDDHLDNAPESGVASGDIDSLPLQPAEEAPPEEAAKGESGSEVATERGIDDSIPNDNVHQDAVSQDSISQDNTAEDDSSENDFLENDTPENDTPEERLYLKGSAEEDSGSERQLEASQREVGPLANGLPDAAYFDVEVPDKFKPEADDSDASARDSTEALDDSADSPDSTPSDEPLLIAPGLSPRRSARRSARRGRR